MLQKFYQVAINYLKKKTNKPMQTIKLEEDQLLTATQFDLESFHKNPSPVNILNFCSHILLEKN